MNDLKPCPFCGVVPRVGYDGTSHFISCGGSLCLVRPSISMWKKDDVIQAWNTRERIKVKPIDVKCPACAAPPGHPCCAFSRNPAPPPMKGFHKERVRDTRQTQGGQSK